MSSSGQDGDGTLATDKTQAVQGAVDATMAADPLVDDATMDAHRATEQTLAADPDGSQSKPRPTVPSGEDPSTLAKGDQLGRYLVVEALGAGGMGVVYRGFDPDLQRQVALKLLLPRARGSSGSGGARARLLREAQAMAQLSHPNIITVYDVGTYQDQVYIAMELVEGSTLDEWLGSGDRGQEEILDIFSQAARGLEAAHAAKLVHRDFKPDNVLVDREGRVRVMDFGLAALLSPDQGSSSPPDETAPPASKGAHDSTSTAHVALDSPLTVQGALLGTPAYMSPEQFEGSGVDARSDQFAFGVALYGALFRQRPFAGKTLAELRKAVQCVEPEPPSGESRVPAWLTAIVLRALAKSPTDRYGSLSELLGDLDRGRRRRQRLAWAIALALLVLAAGGTAFYFQRRSRESTADRDRATDRADRQKRALSKTERELRHTAKAHHRTSAQLAAAQLERERLARYMNTLRKQRAELTQALVDESDAVKRAELACRIAGLEDVIKAPGNKPGAAMIRKAIKRCLGVVKHCYHRALATHPKAHGTLLLALSTDKNGKVIKVSFPKDTVGVPSLPNCLKAVFSRWSIPTGGGNVSPLSLRYPFHFKPATRPRPKRP